MSAVSSARLKIHRGEPTALTRLWAVNLGGFVGSVALACWPLPGALFDLIVEEVLGDGRVSAGGGVGQVEDQGQVQGAGPGGQRFVEHPVTADAFDGDAVPPQLPVEVAAGNGFGAEGGFPGDQDVPVGGVGPGSAAVAKPGSEGLIGEFAESLGVPGDGDAPVGQVEVIQREVPDRT